MSAFFFRTLFFLTLLTAQAGAIAFGFSPASRETFWEGAGNLTGQNFSAFSLAEIDLTLGQSPLASPASLTRAVAEDAEVVFDLKVRNSGTAPLTGISASFASGSDSFCTAGPSSPVSCLATPCLIQVIAPGAAAGVTPISAAPLVSPLLDFGGFPGTCALLPESPARDAATGSLALSGQRGFPTVGIPDPGAYESGSTATNLNAFLWELLPATTSDAQHSAAFDFDGDGQNNAAEWAAFTRPDDPNSVFFPQVLPMTGGLRIQFPTVTGRRYALMQNDTLAVDSWSPVQGINPLSGSGQVEVFTVPLDAGRRFFQVVPAPAP